MSNSDSTKKFVFSKQQFSKSQLSSSSNSPRPTSLQQFPLLPNIQNRFAPLTPGPRPRPPYSSIIQNLESKPIIQSPSTKLYKPASPSTSSPATIPYIINPNKKIIKILEPLEVEKVNKTFFSLIDFIFPKGCHFFKDEYKTRDYYQAILEDSESVIIRHNFNSGDPSKIAYSQVKILKVLSLEDWNSKPYSPKTLSNFSAYPQYNYYDYQDAWEYAFCLRNFDHSWFFQFDEDFSNTYPRWFVKWFKYMGIVSEAFPKEASEAFSKFVEYFQHDGTPIFEYTLQFMSVFRIPWICLWTYNYQEESPSELSPPLLFRQYRCKWWNKFVITKANSQAVTKYYKELTIQYEKSLKSPVQNIKASNEDQEYIQKLQDCNSPEEVLKLINEIRQSPSPSKHSSPGTEVFQDSQDPYDMM